MAENSTLWTWGNQQKYHTEIKEEVDKKLDDYNVTAQGSVVQLGGLQGGVPFSEIAVRGKNILNSNLDVGEVTKNGVTYTINQDKSITLNGISTIGTKFAVGTVNLIKNKKYQMSMTMTAVEITMHIGTGYDTLSPYDYATTSKTITAQSNANTIWLWIPENAELNNVTIYPQLELGDTTTEYATPITGQELTVTACGKNLISHNLIPRSESEIVSSIDNNGIVTVTTNSSLVVGYDAINIDKNALMPIDILDNDCTIGLTWYSGTFNGGDTSDWLGVRMRFYDVDKNGLTGALFFSTTTGTKGINHLGTISKDTIAIPSGTKYFALTYWIPSDGYVTDFRYSLQLEYGSTATAYKPYSGASCTITPDSNPYTVPTEIYQQNGINTVYVTGEGEPTLSVKGVKENAALAKLWSEKMNIDDAPSTYVQKSGDTMEGVLVAQSNVAYTTAQVRNITMSTETASGGSNGQIHFQYT